MNSETSAAYDRILRMVDMELGRLSEEDEKELIEELADFFEAEHHAKADSEEE